MGLFKQTVTVPDGRGDDVDEVDAWVDTGSTYSWLPREVFDRAGVEPSEERSFLLANGTRELRRVAQLRILIQGRTFYTYCAVTEQGEEPLLGSVALEEAGLARRSGQPPSRTGRQLCLDAAALRRSR